ncbi:Lrp/AsnC family transcriptional regulator [Candidatus Woesearchaeota archaeon]|nr:Lrp/AsnC family transcriptional regulator [Candidatus Woesearchaeota archaeon]
MIVNKLDLKDKKILYQLDINARQSNSEIAKKVGLSKDVVNYRIKKLENQDYIKGYYTLLDFSRIGYFLVRVYIKLLDCTPEKEKEILDFLIKKNTLFVARVDGAVDIATGFLVKDIWEFENIYLDFKKHFKPYLGKEEMAVFTQSHQFHRAYILNKKYDEVTPEYSGREKVVLHDELDLKILKLIAKNSRVPIIELSKKLKTPPRTIAFRIKQLEKKKIIQGYRFIFNFGLFGYKYYKIDLILKDISRRKELFQYAHQHPNIMYIDETIGGSDFEFDIEVENEQAFLKLMNDLRARFLEIRSWKYFTLRGYHKLLYFPE